jgi:hypothetical protein
LHVNNGKCSTPARLSLKKNPKNIFKNLWFSHVFFYPFWLMSVCIFIP